MDKEFDQNIESLLLKPKTRQQVADEYGISVNTLKNRLKMIGITLPKGLIFPSTQKIIYSRLGLPSGLKTA
jgi:transcriptional antiterminator